MPEIQMPKLSDTMTEGTLVSWKKKKGDKVTTGEVLAEIETDKATMEWESPEDGTLTEIYVEEGGKVNVGDKIAFIGEEGEEAPKEDKKEEKPKAEPTEEKKAEAEKPAPAKEEVDETAPPQEKEKAAKRAEPKKVPEKPKAPAERSTSAEQVRVKASPVARRVAAELGVDLANVNG